MKKIFFIAVITLSGCNQQSALDAQIEKCVAAGMASWAKENLTEEERRGKEFTFRHICLKAASGKE